ncbi:hypothetical protein KC343_g11874 [Hortaea werneckii]|nr:hypothetical protein KC352_g21866 [Hortaea werneckii]KAI7556846.1 hypothetical protein KC317_g11998 [Hortaea werneckii]KAI7603766.1 hypothetical protein KC346_g11741 [Hortaea werneckii]KAI7610599.1 hypothetical protein KC343_g11874 [Hortaea werneckii]KAI7646833.1 hypothetical protein KC319_g11743 [Hortaea werneckii]
MARIAIHGSKCVEATKQPRRTPSLFTLRHGQTSTTRILSTKSTSQQRGEQPETKIICRSQPGDFLSKGPYSQSSYASISITFEIALYDRKPSTSQKIQDLGRISCSLPWKATFDGSYHAFSAKLKREMLRRVEVQGSIQTRLTDVLLTCPPALREAVVKPESWSEIVSQIAQNPRGMGDVTLKVLVACTCQPAPKVPTPVCRYFGGAKTGISDDEASETDVEEGEEEGTEQPVSQHEGTEVIEGLLTPSTPAAQQGLKRKRLTLATAAEYPASAVLPTTEQAPSAPGWAYRLISDPPAWERNLANRTHSPTDDLLGIRRLGKCRRVHIPVFLPKSA